MTFRYTADHHFGHESIIRNARRPFRDTAHMDAALIEALWQRVGPEDDLWIIGDFAFGPKAKDPTGCSRSSVSSRARDGT